MEMNTRIQVEHPVTECVTGIDLIKEQIRIANGGNLLQAGRYQDDRSCDRMSDQCGDTGAQFYAVSRRITDLHLPGGNGIRVDTAVYSGCEVLPYYDSMLAKLIVHGKDRREAVDKMRSASGRNYYRRNRNECRLPV